MIRLLKAAALAAVCALAPASASAATNQQNSVAYSYALDKCLRYQGCTGPRTGQLLIFTEGNGNAIYDHFYFDTTYCGRKYYRVEVWASGSAHAGNLYGGSC